jgi:acyl-CoA reductase-like NAD-dependent aldehyde dehydrogenase
MTIAQEEIFGPVLCVIPYESVEDAVRLANDSMYGLSGAVFGPEEEAVRVARAIRTGNVYVNDGKRDIGAPFGGYKQSGIGREGGTYGIEEYLEVKAIYK